MVAPIRIMDMNFNLFGEIDDYLSLIWTRRWHKPGEFSLHLDLNSLYTDTLKEDNLIILGDNVGIIKYIQFATGEEDKDMAESVLIRGLTLSSLVNRRITLPPQGQSHDIVKGSAETVMKHYVKNNCVNPTDIKRRIPRLVVAADLSRGGELTYQSRLKALDLELEQLSLISGLGWDIRPDYESGYFVFDIFEGRDLTQNQTSHNPVIFSIEFDNIRGQTYVSNSLDYKNQAYVGGQGEGVERTIIEVGDNAEGWDRYEVFVDARDVENEELLPSRGKEKLLELAQIQSFESRIDHDSTFKYKKDWDLGDIVTVQNRKWGITLNTRITEITEIYEPDGFKLEATFGDTIPTLTDKIKSEIQAIAPELTR